MNFGKNNENQPEEIQQQKYDNITSRLNRIKIGIEKAHGKVLRNTQITCPNNYPYCWCLIFLLWSCITLLWPKQPQVIFVLELKINNQWPYPVIQMTHYNIEWLFMFQKVHILITIYVYLPLKKVKQWTLMNNPWIVIQNTLASHKIIRCKDYNNKKHEIL